MRNFLTRLATMTLLSLATPAAASVINYSGSSDDFGTVAIGQSGTVTNNLSLTGTSTDTGYLPNDATITFTYNFSSLLGGSLSSAGAYNLNSNTGLSGYSYDVSGQSPVSAGYNNGAASAALVLATANLNGADTAGTTTITNLSGSAAQFQSIFSGLTALGNVVSISYAVSAVPLPAAFPLFAVALAGLAGFSMWRKRRML